jgi:hypothetical protein
MLPEFLSEGGVHRIDDPSQAGPAAGPTFLFSVVNERELTCVRASARGDGEAVVWTGRFGTAAEAERRLDWVLRNPTSWTYWGRLSEVLGGEHLSAIIANGLTREAEEREQEEEAARAAAEVNARLSKIVNSHLFERQGRFGVSLIRASERQAFFEMLFRERWERERFRDWWAWQRGRFQEFADFVEAHGAVELERLLLREMLQKEAEVKQKGLGGGGRRPLRFWRGES